MICSVITLVLESVFVWKLLLTFASGWIIYRWTSRKWQNFPPGPIGLPIVGSIPYIEIHAEKTFASWTEIYGPVIMVDIGTTRNVVLNSYEAIEEVKYYFSNVLKFSFKNELACMHHKLRKNLAYAIS